MEINNKILEEYFSYLTVIKVRSPHTIAEFRIDLRLLFMFVFKRRKPSATAPTDCSFADINFIKAITMDDFLCLYSLFTERTKLFCCDVRSKDYLDPTVLEVSKNQGSLD